MDKFIAFFKKSVKGVASENPSDSSWKSFSKYRTKRESSVNALPSYTLWASLLGLLFLLLSNIFWINKSMKLSHQIHEIVTHDTIYIADKIYSSDASLIAFTNTNASEKIENEFALLTNSTRVLQNQLLIIKEKLQNQQNEIITLKATNSILLASSIQQNRNQEFTYNDNLSYENSIIEKRTETNESSFNHKSLVSSTIEELPLAKFNLLKLKNRAFKYPANIIYLNRDKKLNLLEFLNPKSFSLNPNVGIISSHSSDQQSIGFSIGLNGVSNLSRNFRILYGSRFHFSSKELRKSEINNLLNINLQTGESIHEIYIRDQFLEAHVGLEYMIYTHSKWRPFLGLGYSYALFNNQSFEYKIDSGNGERKEIYQNNIEYDNSLQQLYLGIGTDFNLTKKIDIRAGLKYYQSLNNFNNIAILWEAGTYYHF